MSTQIVTLVQMQRHLCAGRKSVELKAGLCSTGDLFMPMLFLLFNLGDLLGRLLSGVGAYAHKSPPAGVLMAYALCRSMLAAALLFCHVVTPHAWRLPELFRSALGVLILVARLCYTPQAERSCHRSCVHRSLLHARGP